MVNAQNEMKLDLWSVVDQERHPIGPAPSKMDQSSRQLEQQLLNVLGSVSIQRHNVRVEFGSN